MTPLERRVLQRAAVRPGARLRHLAHDREERAALVRLVRACLVRVAGDPLRFVGVSLAAQEAAGSFSQHYGRDAERLAVAEACPPLTARPEPPAEPVRPLRRRRAPAAKEPCPSCGREISRGSYMARHPRACRPWRTEYPCQEPGCEFVAQSGPGLFSHRRWNH